MSRPIRRVLFRTPVTRSAATAIHLGRPLLAGSSVLPAHSTGPVSPTPEGVDSCAVWTCSEWGLPSRSSHLERWWSLTPPFHPYRLPKQPAVCSLWHCPAGHPGWLLATTLPCGARTFLGRAEALTRPSGRLIRGPA